MPFPSFSLILLSTSLFFFFFFLLNKIVFFFNEDLGFILFFVLSSFYRYLVCCCVIAVFGLSSTCYDMVLFVVLLRHFICVKAQTSKTDLINRIYQIIVVSILKNLSQKYFSYTILSNLIRFISIYYTINLNIVLSYMIFIYLYFGHVDCKF